MLRRPKPSDSEADLLREQEKFLTSGAPSAANVVRRPDKRRGRAGEGGPDNVHSEGRQRDVVTIEGERCVIENKNSPTAFILWVTQMSNNGPYRLVCKIIKYLLCFLQIFRTNSRH